MFREAGTDYEEAEAIWWANGELEVVFGSGQHLRHIRQINTPLP
jgi:hypothetical protein